MKGLLEEQEQYDKKTYRSAIFFFQHLQQNSLLSAKQQVEVFKCLYQLCTTKLFCKQFSYSNAVSITLRDFFLNSDFPEKEIKACYDYLVKNMPPISNGFNSSMCKRCWYATFKKLIERLGIRKTEKVSAIVYNITGLNIFQKQLQDSYDKKLNVLTNNFYIKFFETVSEIDVHDIKSKSKEKKLADKKMQKQGVDKTLLLKDGSTILVEEKFREPKYWKNRLTDILLEYISIDNKDIPGWVYTSKSDYLVVLYKNPLKVEDSELYILPFKTIRKWVRTHEEEFMHCRDIVASNTNWNTISKEVPIQLLMQMIQHEDEKFKKLYKII